MKKSLQKVIGLITCLTMILTLAAGCSNKTETTENTTTTTEAAATEATTTEAVAISETVQDQMDWETIGWTKDPVDLEWKQNVSPVDISYFANFSWFGLDWTDPTAQKVTEKTGVNLLFSKPVVDDGQKLNIMIAGNQLPDIITLDRNDAAIQTMIDAGMLWSLDELIDQYAPKMREILPAEILNNYKEADGKTYQFTTWVQGKDWQKAALEYNQLIGTNQPVWSIRKDFYDEVGRPEIKTPEDFIAVLEAIKVKHPEKIAFYPAAGSVLSDSFGSSVTMGNVGVQFGLSSNFSVIDGQIKWAVRDPKFVNTLTFLNTLYTKGLLTKDPFIDSNDVAKAKIEQGDVIAYSWTIGDGEKVPADNTATQYEIVGPFSTYEQIRTGAGWLATVITKNTKNPERAIQFLEYLASVEGHSDISWGTQGESYAGDVVAGPHWKLVEGKPEMLPEYVEVKKQDWGGVASKNGLGEYWIACNELLWNLPWWNKSDTKMAAFNETYGPLVVFKPELDLQNPDPASPEGIIKQKAYSLLQEYSVKLIFSDDLTTEYNNFIEKVDELEMSQLETYWNNIYQEKIASMGK